MSAAQDLWTSGFRNDQMILSSIQIVTVAVLGIYLFHWRAGQRRRNSQSWESLVARLRTDWSGRGLSVHFLSREGLNTTPDETWEHIQGIRGLWAIYQNAGVMLEMADYASQNGDSVDPGLLSALRNDATQIRIGVLKVLVQNAFGHASESVRMNAFHVASMYTGMAARMTLLLQQSASALLPDFVAAM
jgi:hypothetical protein